MSAPIVSVNICAYNASRYVVETLHSVFDQTFQDFEIVIVDDGSTDGTAELIEREFPDRRVNMVRQRHATLRFARSIALAHSTGRFIAFLDSDDLWHPEKLARQVDTARARRDPALIICDADLIDADGRQFGRFSEQFAYADMDLRAPNGHLELLRHGNFVASPAPFVEAAAIREAGGFNFDYRHCNDYELWLRLARRHPIVYLPEVLARYRVHDLGFTRQRIDVTLPEQRSLIEPIIASSMYPADVRRALGDNLLGQHRLAWRGFLRQRRYRQAAKAIAGMLRYPDRLLDSIRHQQRGTALGTALERAIEVRAIVSDRWARALALAANTTRVVIFRAQLARARLARMSRAEPQHERPSPLPPTSAHIWIDGTSLSREQTGYFNLLVELIRRLAAHPDVIIHVSTTRAGWRALLARVPLPPNRAQFHACGWRALHWSQIYPLACGQTTQLLLAATGGIAVVAAMVIGSPALAAPAAIALLASAALLADEFMYRFAEAIGRGRERFFARVLRFAWRRWPRPHGRTQTPNTTEILFWRGRFRWADSRRVAIVQDMTTQINPAWHTAGNVREFGEFAGYAQRHAQHILTVSERSRQDIVDRMLVDPNAVSVMPMPIHPQYLAPQFSRGWVAMHRIPGPYVLYVGAIEPRKNLRRLVKAFEWIAESEVARDHHLVLIGPPAWDPDFDQFLDASDIARRVIRLGFVAHDHLPSLYHYASAVVMPSLYEGFGIPVMEAMCSSGIVVASRAGSLPEVLGTDGILFDPTDSRAIAASLLSAITMPQAEADAYRHRCRRRAEAHLERLATEPPLPWLRPITSVPAP